MAVKAGCAQEKRKYYKISFVDSKGDHKSWHASRNGTDRWGTHAKVKAVITRGIRSGYKGQIREEFENYDIIEFTETVKVETRLVPWGELH